MPTWDPERYLTFADQRGRPFVELLSRVAATSPHTVVDLGCGPGNLTRLLAERWPDAEVTGLDSSAEMIARARHDIPGLRFDVADLRDWRPAHPVDVVISNATLQWVPDHLALLPALLAATAPSGWLAFQVPGNFGEPSHALLHELAAEAPYADFTAGVDQPASHEPDAYYDALAGAGTADADVEVDVDVWETTYTHVLTGPDPVFTWVSGTGARPTLQALPDELRPAFEVEYRRRLADAYPVRRDGTVLLPFRRIFAVAHRAGARPPVAVAPGG